MTILLLTFFVAIVILFLLVVRDTVRGKGRLGINLAQIKCPHCSQRQPRVKAPASLQQAAWGGRVCSRCGCEFDKWGVEKPQNESDPSDLPKVESKEDVPIEYFRNGKTPLEKVLSEEEEK